MRRKLIKALAVAVLLVAAIFATVWLYLRQSLPSMNGNVAVVGITASVEIIRDAGAVPHIFAATKLDALFGLGYAHAQDRLWQMELQRRIGFGRLSEIFGGVAVSQDRFLRTVGFGRAARAAWDRLPGEGRRQVDAYIAGVNAFIAAHRGRLLPPEFTLLRFEPEPWTGPDVLVWGKMMAWDLSENYRFEMMRHDLAARVGIDRMRQLTPPYPADGLNILGASTIDDTARLPSDERRDRRALRRGYDDPPKPDAMAEAGYHQGSDWSDALARSVGEAGSPFSHFLLSGRTESLGSNNWVVDGTLTASGKPLLANDPHLGTQIPSVWYLAHLSAGDFDVIGATLPGLPAVAIGRNRFIAWGETNAAADVEDLYLERIDEAGRNAEFRGVQEPMRIITEVVAVKGGPPVEVQVRITRHGPIISDAINANSALGPGPRSAPLEPLALRWTALDPDDRTILAFLQLNDARNWIDFTGALRDFATPSQNFVYADVDGHIGYYAPGRIPIRARGDGSMPVEGWTGDAEWTGWIPFEELPHAYDPPAHFIVTANNRPMGPGYPHLIALEYPNAYRAQRITDLIRGRGGLTPDDFRAIQADTFSLHAQSFLPLLLRHVHPRDARDEQAVAILRQWNFDARGDSAAAAIFQAWFLQLEPTIVGDDLGETANGIYRGRFSFITRFVTNLLTSSDSSWCDDVRTNVKESCDDSVTKALHDGVATLTRLLGSDLTKWRWDSVHRAVFPHQGLDAVGMLRPLLNRSMPNGGDWSTVNVGPVDVGHPFDQVAVAGYRQIVDLSPANDSRFIDAVGQSGHFLSKYYDDSLQDWHDVRHRPMRMNRDEIEKDASHRLTLVPR